MLIDEDDRGPVRIIAFNAPETRNSWSEAMHIEYLDALDRAAEDARIGVIVVTGRGDAFSSGGDFDRLKSIAQNGWTPYRDPRNVYHAIEIPKPIVGAINGAAIGMGLVQACYCDFRIISQTAVLGAGFPRLGLVAEHGLSWFLPRLIGAAAAMEILLHPKLTSATRAYELGLASAIEPDGNSTLDAAVQMATMMCQAFSPRSLAAIKLQIYRHLDASLDRAMKETEDLTRTSLASADFREGIAAMTERRKPNFSSSVPVDQLTVGLEVFDKSGAG